MAVMMSWLVRVGVCFSFFGIVSCAVSPEESAWTNPSRAGGTANANANSVLAEGQSGGQATAAELRELRERQESVGNSVSSPEEVLVPYSAGANTPVVDLPPLPPVEPEYRYAIPVPGRPGWVYNPYTNRPLDVRGIASGRLIYDETDPENRNPDGTLKEVVEITRRFRVP